ncbi:MULTISPECIES: hypothetical protein [Aerococcus]|uniref:Uncharacterized protein n=1 Tax=Aerococcus sanguinicola TaxID=119206 RepID=A0A5N1GLT0_9LACT|nr:MULTISPECIES: hypothetical protein [Aerococcus]KAA9301945.1 hypothetical protein F6I03_01695 [Aerococcus sanguinicola]MDK6368631.1 hypothetical protein [Aerococcus sp. UMB9870]MDK6679714.1 hypothetical protein [Aerococcus sp. UMB8608]MDK6686014.1 hypothetical protein [Aerococcus sp. UMB8623]MDK6940820.1 hypothetical protein [Aerococcus sp. UMB8487]
MSQTLDLKKALIRLQFGDYLPLVQAFNYQDLDKVKNQLTFNFAEITDQAAFYMVARGYLAHWESPYQKESLVRKGNRYRQDNRVVDEVEDDFLEAVWQAYVQVKEEAQSQDSARGQSVITRHGSQESIWEQLMRDGVPELKQKVSQYKAQNGLED